METFYYISASVNTISHLIARLDPNQGCTKATCPASDSIYGYVPSLAASVLFLIFFSLSGIAHAWQGIQRRTWFFGSVMVIGCISEVLGYVAKLILYNDVFSSLGFQLSVVVLTFAPAFYSAGIYYTLKHIVITFGSSFSRLRPSWYTWIFISCDLFSIVLQAVGGGLASGANDDAGLRVGDNVTIAGLASQVFTLLAFGACAIDYALAARRHQSEFPPKTAVLRRSMRFRLFLGALMLAYVMILIRCCYRLAELAQGWGPDNPILRNQGLFIGLDSVPCAIATIVLNCWHPGWCFPEDVEHSVKSSALSSGDSSDEEAKQTATV